VQDRLNNDGRSTMKFIGNPNHPDTNQPYTYPCFAIGDKVIDRTAEMYKWDDIQGEIVDIDGSNIKVKYTSGNERWKMSIDLRYKSNDSDTY
jgi:hypothetical protein